MRVSASAIEFEGVDAEGCCGRSWPGMPTLSRGPREPLPRCAVRPGTSDALARADGGEVEAVEDPIGAVLVRYAVRGRVVVERAPAGRLDCTAR